LSVAVVVVAYDSGDHLTRCLDALHGEADEVVVVNNGGPVEVDVPVVESGGNLGFGAGCNLGVRHVSSDVVVFLNPDTVAQPGAVRALERTLLDDETVGVVQARVLLADRPDLVNTSGNLLHVSGLAGLGGYGEPASAHSVRREIAYASGAACAIRRDLFLELGGFTEELFLYQEDLELSWRAWQRGRRVVVEPAADVLHDYVLERADRRKEYFLERNRLVFVLTAYSGRLLALLAPVLLAVELGITLVAARNGWLREKASGWAWLARNAGWLRAHRARLQRERRVSDGELARLLTPRFELAMVDHPPGTGLLNACTSAWWRVVRVLL
jgi:GT2 family glycosyltransferase